MSENNNVMMSEDVQYDASSIITLEGLDAVRLRPGMYVGKLGNGSDPADGMYVLLKEVVDNSIDEFAMGNGKTININIEDKTITVRDFGRGIPFEKLEAAVSILHTGAKFDTKTFKKSVGLNGVGLKAVNALSSEFIAKSYREGRCITELFRQGKKVEESIEDSKERNGMMITFTPDQSLFEPYTYNYDFIENLIRNYSYLNVGLTINLNGNPYKSENGLLDLLNDVIEEEPLYEPIHLSCPDLEVVFTHGNGYGENVFSFVNGQNTILGGFHASAFKEAIVKTLKDYYKRDINPADIRQSFVGAISIKVEGPDFEGQTKVKLGTKYMSKDGPTISKYVGDFISTELDNYLHKHLDVADIINKKIADSEKERIAISSTSKKTKARLKKASIHNKKLRDCRVHFGDKSELAAKTMIFITEGDSASGSITKSRDANTQAVFSLMGKPCNCVKASKKTIYEERNIELCLLQAALDIEENIDNLRYNYVIIATDADVDGMHIRLLLMTFFLKFYPEMVRQGHLYILQTPLFRVRDKKSNYYCYSSAEKEAALKKIGKGAEITRFKGLGEISPDEFRGFINEDIKLENVRLTNEDKISDIIDFYMGENTIVRQDFIRANLRSDINNVEEEQ